MVGRKGVAGNKTGAAARKAIRRAEKAGYTHAEIGRATRRSVSTVGGIKSGEIKNPPRYEVTAINNLARKKKA